jgi:hypothetical protein
MISILNKLLNGNTVDTTSLKREYQIALNCFERAMRNHGINSDEANHWAAKADQAERALAA